MTRGRRPLMALREAVLIAKKRGETQAVHVQTGHDLQFRDLLPQYRGPCPGSNGSPASTATTHGSSVRQPMHSQHSGLLHPAGCAPTLGLFAPRCIYGFFRVTDTGLVELDRDGARDPGEVAQPSFRQSRHSQPDRPRAYISLRAETGTGYVTSSRHRKPRQHRIVN